MQACSRGMQGKRVFILAVISTGTTACAPKTLSHFANRCRTSNHLPQQDVWHLDKKRFFLGFCLLLQLVPKHFCVLPTRLNDLPQQRSGILKKTLVTCKPSNQHWQFVDRQLMTHEKDAKECPFCSSLQSTLCGQKPNALDPLHSKIKTAHDRVRGKFGRMAQTSCPKCCPNCCGCGRFCSHWKAEIPTWQCCEIVVDLVEFARKWPQSQILTDDLKRIANENVGQPKLHVQVQIEAHMQSCHPPSVGNPGRWPSPHG